MNRAARGKLTQLLLGNPGLNPGVLIQPQADNRGARLDRHARLRQATQHGASGGGEHPGAVDIRFDLRQHGLGLALLRPQHAQFGAAQGQFFERQPRGFPAGQSARLGGGGGLGQCARGVGFGRRIADDLGGNSAVTGQGFARLIKGGRILSARPGRGGFRLSALMLGTGLRQIHLGAALREVERGVVKSDALGQRGQSRLRRVATRQQVSIFEFGQQLAGLHAIAGADIHIRYQACAAHAKLGQVRAHQGIAGHDVRRLEVHPMDGRDDQGQQQQPGREAGKAAAAAAARPCPGCGVGGGRLGGGFAGVGFALVRDAGGRGHGLSRRHDTPPSRAGSQAGLTPCAGDR